MWHRIAALLGGCTVEELQERMSAEEFADWRDFYELEPFGPGMDNWRAALITAQLHNDLLKLSGSNARSPKDFMPKIEK